MIGKEKRGWIGVDVGQRAIKVAQLIAERDRVRLAAAAISLRPNSADEPVQLAGHFGAARALAERLKGNQAAATLSMQSCEVQPADEEAPAPPDRCVGSWNPGATGGYTLSADLKEIENTVEGLSRAGWHCEVIDGQPLVIARALQLSPGYDRKQLLGGLDLGETCATFVASSDGVARYVRRLHCGGMASLCDGVAESLGVSPKEAGRLLRQEGVPSQPFSGGEQRVLHDAVKNAARPLVQEMQRTLEHLGGKLKCRGPERLFLFGAGGAVPGLATMIGSSVDVSAEPWRAGGLRRDEEVADLPDCLLAQAIALSALAWESNQGAVL